MGFGFLWFGLISLRNGLIGFVRRFVMIWLVALCLLVAAGSCLLWLLLYDWVSVDAVGLFGLGFGGSGGLFSLLVWLVVWFLSDFVFYL